MRKRNWMLVAGLTGALLMNGAALADKPSWAGDKHAKKGKQTEAAAPASDDRYRFDDDARRIVSDYYTTQARAGKCPPGLAKKQNGCLPPGQAKKWARGKPLPADVVYHDLPRELLRRLPPPPSKHRYVEVAGDVLMIAVGTSLVVDAIDDLMR